METIQEAQEYLEKEREIKQGVDCPCCGQRVKIYKRKLNQQMAETLIKLYKLHKNQPEKSYWHITTIGNQHGGDFAKLIHWGLIAPAEFEVKNGRTNGFWGITVKGRLFVEDSVKVPDFIKIYNKKKYGESEDLIGIRDALKYYFNYKDI